MFFSHIFKFRQKDSYPDYWTLHMKAYPIIPSQWLRTFSRRRIESMETQLVNFNRSKYFTVTKTLCVVECGPSAFNQHIDDHFQTDGRI